MWTLYPFSRKILIFCNLWHLRCFIFYILKTRNPTRVPGFSLEINLRFRGFVVKNWNLPFTVEDFHESKQSLCVGSEMFLANPRKLFSFAIYITLSCQILDIVITLVVDETHQSGKRLKSQRNSSQVHIKQVCAIWVFLFYERTAKSIQRRWSANFSVLHLILMKLS